MLKPLKNPLIRTAFEQKPIQKRLIVGLGLAMITLFSAVGLLAVSGWFITAAAFSGTLALIGAINIYTPGAAIRLFAVLRTVARYGERVVNHDAILRIQSHWRSALFTRLSKAPQDYLFHVPSGTLEQKATRDLAVLDIYWLRILSPWFLFVGLSLLVFMAFLLVYWPLALLFALSALALGLYSVQLARRTTAQARAEYDAERQMRNHGNHFIQLLAEQLAWGQSVEARGSLLKASNGLANTRNIIEKQAARAQAVTQLGHHLLITISTFGVMMAWQQERVTGPLLVMCVLALLAIFESWQQVVSGSLRYGEVERSLDSLADMETENSPQRDEAQLTAAGLFVENMIIRKRGRLLLQIPRLQIEAGTHVCILGSSGIGKTSFAQSLLLNAGDPSQFGYLTQHDEILHGSVWENLTLGDMRISEEEVWRVLDWVGLSAWAHEHQLNYILTPRGGNISGGQARRLCLARVLLRDTPYVILDEPYRGLDRETRAQVERSISPWLAHRTVIYLAHRKTDVETAHRYYQLQHQQLIEI